MTRTPQAIVVIIVWCYWLSVLLLLVRSRIKFRASGGAVPKTKRESWMWLVWVPTVVLWQVLPILAYRLSLPLIAAPQWAVENPNAVVDWLAVLAASLAYFLTIPCWLTLGSNWSLAVVPSKKTSLVTRGVFARTRHPIYALGIVLMAATVAVAPSVAMFAVGISHLTMVALKAASEENHLKCLHGDSYREYCLRTGRFFPRIIPGQGG
jgi:protein-S-isoprenylcysteine O-methyltransferase Ste14